MEMLEEPEEKDDEVYLKNLKLKKTEIIAKQILLYFIDFNRAILPFFDKKRIYRVPFKIYDKFRLENKEKFHHEMYRLKQAGFIKKYFDGKDYYLELLPKGQNQIKTYLTKDLKITSPKKWDKKWRVVIYDIANDKKDKREILREKLNNLGFIELQESVYIHPFDCLNEINLLKNMYYITPHVQYLVVERLETEINLIKKFYDRGILKDSML